jgi:hypothetical protein
MSPEHNPGEPEFGEHTDEAPHNPGEPEFGAGADGHDHGDQDDGGAADLPAGDDASEKPAAS